MPVITITMGEGQTSPEQKKQLIENITSQAVEVTRLPAQSFTVLINELSHDCIGVGGQTLKEMLVNRS